RAEGVVITVLFACVHNAGRSQIAAALFNKYVARGRAHAISAGTDPAAQVHPEVIATMRRRGIDLSTRTPQRLTTELASAAQWLITMGCGGEWPMVPGAQRDGWPIQDPKGQPPAVVDAIIDDIDRRVRLLIERLF